MTSKILELNASITVFIAVAGALGNCLIIYAFLKLRSLRTTNNVFLFQLALVDLTRAVVLLPVKAYTQFHAPGKTTDLGSFCQVSGFISTVTFILSALLLAAIAVVRYFKIVNTRNFDKMFTRRRMVCYCAGMFTATFLLALLPIVGVGEYVFSYHHGVCFTKWSGENIIFRSLFYVYIIGICYPILIFCYTKIFIKLRRHKSSITVSMKEQPGLMSTEELRDLESGCKNGGNIGHIRKSEQISYHPAPATLTGFVSRSDSMEAISSRNSGQEKAMDQCKESGNMFSRHNKKKAKQKKSLRNEIRVTKVMFTVVIAYSLCWLPAFFVNVLQLSGAVSLSDSLLYLIVTLVELKTFINPVIYGLWNHQFRKALKSLFISNYSSERTSNTNDSKNSQRNTHNC